MVFGLVLELERSGTPFLFLDWKRTFRHLLPNLSGKVEVHTPGRELAPLAFNPFIPPPGVDERIHLSQVLDLLGASYTLGDGAKSLLQQGAAQVKEKHGEVSVARLLEWIQDHEVKGRAIGWRASALRALQTLNFVDVFGSAGTDQAGMVKRLCESSTVVELDALDDNAKGFLVSSLLLWIYNYRLRAREREKLKLVVVIEEAHHVLKRQDGRARETVLDRVLRQCREIGIGVVIVDQHPHLISSAALGNSFASIILNLKNPADISRAAALSGLREDEKQFLSRLAVGQGVVKLQDRWREPFLVEFPHVDVEKGAVTDEALAEYLARSRETAKRSEANNEDRPSRGVFRRVRSQTPLGSTAVRLLLDCSKHPSDGVKRRYERLGLSMEKGGKLRGELLEGGWVTATVIVVGRARRLILTPTAEARRKLGLGAGARLASVEHEFWKHYYAEKFRDAGYTVELEAPRAGGTVDLLARTRGERVGIEVETGKSDVVRNVRKCLRSRFDRVVVVATTEEARQRVEGKLATAGLLVRGRVRVVRAKGGCHLCARSNVSPMS